jgi:three-Cys-motif partner protein
MGTASFHPARDGGPARVAESWTEEKLMILDGYVAGGPERKGGFAQACASAGGWYGLDLFAGTGLNWSSLREEEINGSPLILLNAGEPEALKVILCEQDARAGEALRERVAGFGARFELFAEKNANEIVGDMLARVPVRAAAFAFLDPEGSELDWATVQAIADHKRGRSPNKVEQLILFPTDTGFVRLAPDYPDMVTRMFGNEDWIEIYERHRARQITADRARGEYVQLYAQGLKGLG